MHIDSGTGCGRVQYQQNKGKTPVNHRSLGWISVYWAKYTHTKTMWNEFG